jgi:hypothetical protein
MKERITNITSRLQNLEEVSSEVDPELLDVITLISTQKKKGFIMAAYFEETPEGTKRTCAFVSNEMRESDLIESITSIGAAALNKANEGIADGTLSGHI